jgi:hypothetical protein
MAFFALANRWSDNNHYNYKFEEHKTVEQTFDVEALPNLVMNGRYSDFIITTWDQPQIDFKVKITVKSDKESTVKKLMEIIDVELSQNGNTVKAKTVFIDNINRSYNASLSIKYHVNVPQDVLMDLETKYGDITIDKAYQKMKAEIKYGDFRADSLMIENFVDNQVRVQYGNVNIDYVNKFVLRLDYGEGKINKCEYVDGFLRYSKIFITDLTNASLENKYSDTRIEKAWKVQFVNTAYSDLKVLKCTNLLFAKLQYSDLSATMTSGSPIVDINAQYSDVNLFINEDASFNYNLESTYSDITFRGFFDSKSISGQGHYGDGERGRLDITTIYGDVDIRKNK